jgi:hypothetical protein
MTNLIEDGMNAIRDTGNKLNQPAGRAPIVRLGERKLRHSVAVEGSNHIH